MKISLLFRSRSEKSLWKNLLKISGLLGSVIFVQAQKEEGSPVRSQGGIFWAANSLWLHGKELTTIKNNRRKKTVSFQCIYTPFKGGWSRSDTFYITHTRGGLTYRKSWSNSLLWQCLANHQGFQQPYISIMGTTNCTGLEGTPVFSL